jgi:hypothetical protein
MVTRKRRREKQWKKDTASCWRLGSEMVKCNIYFLKYNLTNSISGFNGPVLRLKENWFSKEHYTIWDMTPYSPVQVRLRFGETNYFIFRATVERSHAAAWLQLHVNLETCFLLFNLCSLLCFSDKSVIEFLDICHLMMAHGTEICSGF